MSIRLLQNKYKPKKLNEIIGNNEVINYIKKWLDDYCVVKDFLKKNGGFHPINLGTGQGLSVLEIVHSFEKACSKKIPYRVISRRPGDIDSCYANVQKAAFQLNWKAERTLKEMCESAWKFQQSIALK